MTSISIEGRTYQRNPEVDRYQIPYDELGDLRMKDIPRQSHVEIMNLPVPDGVQVKFYAVNGSSDTKPSFFIYGGPQVQCATADEAVRVLSKMKRSFPDLNQHDTLNPFTLINGTRAYTHIGLDFDDRPNTRIREIFERLVGQMSRLSGPTYHVFVCHASEDKAKARSLARSLKTLGTDVWLDEWEIRAGDSIVQKINEALSKVTHLIVLLSKTSCAKPWVAREWSSALMRQLADNSIAVLPVRLDDHPLPPILADLRYADCRASLREGVAQLKQALTNSGELR
jgi:hypothetical protein